MDDLINPVERKTQLLGPLKFLPDPLAVGDILRYAEYSGKFPLAVISNPVVPHNPHPFPGFLYILILSFKVEFRVPEDLTEQFPEIPAGALNFRDYGAYDIFSDDLILAETKELLGKFTEKSDISLSIHLKK